MKNTLQTLFLLLLSSGLFSATAQPVQLADPFDLMLQRAAQNNPNFKADLAAHQADLSVKAAYYLEGNNTAARGTGTNRTIPVIFHIVLDTTQMTQMDGQPGVIARIHSQIEVLNEAFNAGNADSIAIPSAFKPYYTNMNIRFALAAKTPQGMPSPGYEFISTTRTGFRADGGGTAGSTYYCSDAKYASIGGADAWDATRYLNVWVINIAPSGVGGVGTPPPYAVYGGTAQFPWAEQGVALLYSTLGKQTSASQFFLTPTANKGRILVHELGHFFNLFHPFGMSTLSNTDCQDDDGVPDTPPQALPTQSYCPVFPLTDGCSHSSPGIMYMNYMDYEAADCALMFSNGQKARVYVETEPVTGFRYGLFQNPQLLAVRNTPAAVQAVKIYPNPATTHCNIIFNTDRKPGTISLVNALGQLVYVKSVEKSAASLDIELNGFPRGVYLLQLTYSDSNSNTLLSLL